MSRRRLSSDERELWNHVTRSIAPLRKAVVEQAEAAELHAPSVSKRASKPKPMPVVLQPAVAKPAASPALAPLGRRFKQRLKRGTDAIDGRIDLHGLTQAEAHSALLHFLRRSQGDGGRNVLVITGKGGSDATSGRGVLKRQAPLWLGLPEFRGFIVGFESASIAHGGEGALYVRLRRTRDTGSD
jgi:DNA-nicking Smr family endonuclease